MTNKPLISVLFAIFLLLGIFVGTTCGKFLFSKQEQPYQKTQDIKIELTREFNFLMTLIYATRMSGEITIDKENTILNIFQKMGYTDSALTEIASLLKQYNHRLFDIHEVIQYYMNTSDEKQRLLLFKCVSLVTLSNGPLSIEEKEFLQEIHTSLQLN